MNTPGQGRVILGSILLFLFVLFAAGCGGGDTPSSTSSGGSTAAASPDTVIADAGDIVAVRVDEVAILDGTGSSTSLSAPLTYAWAFTHKPAGSTTDLVNPTSANPSFTADVEGTYMVELVVSAGGVSSRRAIGFVEVTVSGNVTGMRVHTSYPAQCSECHDGRYAVVVAPFDPVPPKSPLHMATSNMCQACHTTFGFNLIRFVDHQEVFGNCSSCHDGVVAIGKSDLHLTTNAECDSCHSTTSFVELALDGTFDHTGITSGCVRCHNGTTAIGTSSDPTPPHPDTTSDCSYCHTTTAFTPAYPDHGISPEVVNNRCDFCHNATGGGFGARDQIAGHPIMNVDCGTCHSISSFNMGGIFNHRLVDSVTQPCSTCHVDPNGINAPFKPATHIPTTTECNNCHSTTLFNPAFVDHTSNDVTSTTCESCHDGSPIIGKHATHLLTTRDCNACHIPGGTFTTGTFDHGIETNGVTCDFCHNDSISAGKPFNHIPTAEDCGACHTTTTFVGAVFNHTGITNGCTTCHDGSITTGKGANHIPTTPNDQDCVDCHAASLATFTDFTGGTFDHIGVINNCATCHDGSYVTSGALGKIPNHIPAQQECSQCHIDTTVPGGFASLIFMTDVHPNLATGCEGCHKDQFLLNNIPPAVKAAGHLPTNQDCHFCHTNVSFTPQNFTHAGITGNCSSCHDGNYVVPAGALGKADDPTPPHPDTTADCGVCHGIGANFADGVFDHTGRVDNCNECHADGATGAVTKKNAGHVPTTQDCSVCHVPGTFATAVFSHDGIVDNCSTCHDGAMATATVKPATHLPTAQDCSVCHNTTAFLGARFDHTGIVDNCATCHDGVVAIGKHGTHVPTNNDCSVCHLTTGFIPGNFDHTGIVDNCASCHDGSLARGKIDGHILTNADCGACHTTRGFIPATFDHSTITNATRCDSCHGVTATGKDAKTNPPHLTTDLDCRSCHTTSTFVGGTWVHDASTTGVCDTCHRANGDATPKPSGHLPTTVQCDGCHTTNGWAPVNFSHDPNGNYPGDHARAPSCSGCHGNTIVTPFVYRWDQYAPFCAACHAGDFDRQDEHNGGNNGTVEQNKDCSGGGRGCHRVTDRNFD